jgi:retinol dehydrogenase-12
MGGFLGFIYRQKTFTPKPLPPSTSLAGSTVLITGANIGLGYAAALHIASRSPSLLILCVRDISKGETAKSDILKTSSECNIEVWPLDYDTYDSIVAFGKRVSGLERLDYVLLNAGVKYMEFTPSKTGHEMNVQINHLATSLISLLLLPTLQQTSKKTGKPSRLSIISSEGHFWVPFKERTAPNILARMDEPETFGSQMNRYYTTKLLNVLWVRELTGRVNGKEVVVNTVNPGFCYSGLHRHMGAGVNVFLWLFGWTSEQGGYCLVDAMVGHEGSHGAYISEQKVTEYVFSSVAPCCCWRSVLIRFYHRPSSFVLSKEGEVAQKKVWDETVALLKKEAPDANFVIP